MHSAEETMQPTIALPMATTAVRHDMHAQAEKHPLAMMKGPSMRRTNLSVLLQEACKQTECTWQVHNRLLSTEPLLDSLP